MPRKTITTQVAIMGAGPAGLMLSHLLATQGIESTVVEIRGRREIQETVRAGILEHGTVNLLVDSGVSDRVLREGDRHDGIVVRFNGESHRIDFKQLVGESVWLYPQTDVFMDLAARREADGGDVRYSVSETTVHDLEGKPKVRFTDADGREFELQADFLVGADGSRSHCRFQIPEANRTWYFHEYPFAWFGILAEAPRSLDVLIYANSEHGFALISQRTETVQRMYFQCDPKEDVADWDDEMIWTEFRKRVNGNGFELREGRGHREDRPAVPQPGPRPHALREPVPRRRRGPQRPAHGGQGPEPGHPRRPRAVRRPRSLLLDRFHHAARFVQRPRPGTRVESPALLLLDDLHAAHASRAPTTSSAAASSAS